VRAADLIGGSPAGLTVELDRGSSASCGTPIE
jgi:hypothetical protein